MDRTPVFPSLCGCLCLFLSVSLCLCLSVSLLQPFVCCLSLSLSICQSSPLTPYLCACLVLTVTTVPPLSRQGSAGPARLAGFRAAAAVPQLRAGALGAALLLGAGARPRVGPLGGAGQGGAQPHPAGAGPPRVGGAWQCPRRWCQWQQRGLRGPSDGQDFLMHFRSRQRDPGVYGAGSCPA